MEDWLVAAGLIAGTWLLLLWLSIIVWAYRDIRERTRDLGLQVLAVFVVMLFFPGFNIPGLALYLMMRPRESLEEAYSRSLEEEALLREIGDEGLCPSCRRFVERSWRICPFCQTQLKDVCTQCEQLLSFNWVVCPYCTTERKGAARRMDAMPPPAVATAARQQAARTTADDTGTADDAASPAGAREAQRSGQRGRVYSARDTEGDVPPPAPSKASR